VPPLLDLTDALDRAGSLAARGPAVLGIAGPPGAGKSSLAAALVAAVPGAVLLGMDGFHLAQQVLDARGLAARKGAPDTFDRDGYVATLTRVRSREADVVYAPEFRREIEEPIAGAVAVPRDCPLVVTEGNYLLLWPQVRPLLTETWWTECPDDVRRQRLVDRHRAFGKPEAAARAFALGSDEANAQLVAPGRELADALVDCG
jgi:pantothenate kinase